jgi:hypothetical protein
MMMFEYGITDDLNVDQSWRAETYSYGSLSRQYLGLDNRIAHARSLIARLRTRCA